MCFYQNVVLIAEYHVDCEHTLHCDEFPVPQIDRRSKQVKNSDRENFICNQYVEQLTILNTKNIKICG